MITSDIQKLEVDSKIELFELDLTPFGSEVMRFHPYNQNGSIWWQGKEYHPWAIEVEGFEKKGEGTQPTPTLRVSNIEDHKDGTSTVGIISSLCIQLDDMVGAKLTRHITFAKHLDARNFPEGNPSADPEEELEPSIWFIEQKTSESKRDVEFQLKTALDLNDQQFPARKVIGSMCSWLLMDREVGGGYRGPFCNYTGGNMFDRDGNPVRDPAKDACGGRVSDCKKRFGEYSVINFGGQPSADNLRGY